MQSVVSVLERPIPLRLRDDLQVVPQHEAGHARWIVKDPLTLEYFHLEDREYQLLTLLDGVRSLREIKRLYEDRFPGDRLSATRFHTFCLALQRDGLLLGPAADPQMLVQRRHEHDRAKRQEQWANPLAIRFRGIDPQPILDTLYPLTRWMFSPAAVGSGLLMSALVFLFVATRFDLFREQLPEFRRLLTGTNLLLLMLAVFLTKVVHELAHGLTCKHFGGECRELGVMLLVFTPCLYCDVSDAWLLPSRYRRIGISAAGMFVETVLAAICLAMWWFSREGPLRLFFLNTVLVCTVATVVFNANPLLRFDGYYILSDCLGVPNLWAQSRAQFHRWIRNICLGIREHDPLETPPARQWTMFVYALASIAYRWTVIVAIVWLVFGLLKPIGLEALAYAAIGVVLAASLVPGLWAVKRQLQNPLQRRTIKRWRLATSLIAGGGLLAFVLLIPWPLRTHAPAVIRLSDAAALYATRPGTLVSSMPYGSEVQAGETVAQLRNAELALELQESEGKRDRQQTRLQTLLTVRGSDPAVAAEIPTATEILHDYEARVSQLQRQMAELTIRSPRTGTLLPPESIDPGSDPVSLDTAWESVAFDSENVGSYLELGTYLGQVGDRGKYHAEMFLTADQIEAVRLDQRVDLRLRESPGRVLRGKVSAISPADRQDTSRPIGAPGAGSRESRAEEYRVQVELVRSGEGVTIGAPGVARIHTPPVSLATRISRSLARLFRLGA